MAETSGSGRDVAGPSRRMASNLLAGARWLMTISTPLNTTLLFYLKIEIYKLFTIYWIVLKINIVLLETAAGNKEILSGCHQHLPASSLEVNENGRNQMLLQMQTANRRLEPCMSPDVKKNQGKVSTTI
jgi:hypothetical protein